jgi:hypothetical protein
MLHIFSGPSLDHETIKGNLEVEAVVNEPIKGGDILTLLSTNDRERVSHIHIIDGYYYNVPSVRHKEILQALEQGVIVSGCSSMGAIRAAECREYGMIGTGKVYEYYQNSFMTGDDEVSVVHHPAPKYTTTSTALINIRFALDKLICLNKITENEKDEVIGYFKNISFGERHIRNLKKSPKFKHYYDLLVEVYIDWKKKDAIDSLQLLGSMKPTKHRSRNFFAGYNHVNFYNDTTIDINGIRFDRSSLPSIINKHDDYPRILYDAFNRSLVVKFAKHLNIVNQEAEISAFMEFTETLKNNKVRYGLLPKGYENYSRELIDQELLILKMQLWMADSAGLSGNLGVLSDYIACLDILNTESERSDTHNCALVFYTAFSKLLGHLTDVNEELLIKYIGLSMNEFIGKGNTSLN